MSDDRSSRSGPGTTPGRETGERWIDRLLAGLGLRAGPSIRDDLEDALEETAPGGEFSPLERAMLKNVLALRELRVDDAMVPRADIIAVQVGATLEEVLHSFRTAGHSRLPVYGETLDDPRGMIHIRDFVDFIAAQAEAGVRPRGLRGAREGARFGLDLSMPLSAAKILRPVLYVPPSMPAMDLLVKMQATRTHMALVIDEYGGTDGLVSMEDLVEMVVGDIEDEHDEEEAPQIARGEHGTFTVDARASLEEVAGAIGVELAEAEVAEEVDTLGGLIVTLAGRVPVRGELVPGPGGLEFEVLDADPRRLKRIRVHLRGAEAGDHRKGPRREQGAATAAAEALARGPAADQSAPASTGDAAPAASTVSPPAPESSTPKTGTA
ncbi:hemolysin family protein [Chelatococcus sp. SYSU_G07232]|uniref:Hemolysin family protein n=1 Tax=Chelatococcus albus TaxID=3047466 RepID=A0ABT7AH93_9HYPH|nr:hemolysin family protein [Chelatococcus sp. SYSU_G07232]MDJ1158751.1 hemolysin family protein [Chelatococcus sp. SYSU_G07232]